MRRWPCWIRTMRHRSPSELLCLQTAEKRRERERDKEDGNPAPVLALAAHVE